MSTISALTSGNAATATTSDVAAATATKKTLGQDDFLKLLAQQFQSQDPMKPMDDSSFIAQMAQFTSLQQSSTMTKDISALKSQQQVATANSYLGHRVTVDIGEGQTVSGDVTGVKMVNGTPQLVVNGEVYALSSVLLVEPSAVTNTSTSNNPSQ
jgi:flagellar basal-body rod modification protein FlgD